MRMTLYLVLGFVLGSYAAQGHPWFALGLLVCVPELWRFTEDWT